MARMAPPLVPFVIRQSTYYALKEKKTAEVRCPKMYELQLTV
jgi:hypothetical protein